MLSPASEAVATSRASSESLSSNPDSPLKPETSLALRQDVDVDLGSKSYACDLLECGLKEERFRIDRKKLEDMLQIQNTNGTIENAETFFQRVMKNTNTLISWPSKLKIGAKSKKDPHVKIVGLPEAVQMAKSMILEILDTKKNRVTLKMDVSHSDHSYIIGKGGFKIQQVMEETGCHIHFPDSNRNNSAEKSNQVSIAGQASGVELARAKIRDLLPLVFMFELPNGKSVNPGEETSPAIQHIQKTYSFNVTFRSIGPVGMGRTLVVFRGCQHLLSRLRQGLSLLMEYLTGSKTIPVMGFMKTEIAAQHHQFVMGTCNVNTQMIMNKTGASIIFPDPAAFGPESPTQAGPVIAGHSILRTKSTVIIQGSFDSVCLAWQELLKCLPLVLMFDLKEGHELDSVMVNNFIEAFNINIMVRPKIRENTKSVLIRGAEKDYKILFEVRKAILGLEEDDSSTASPCKPSFKAQTTSYKSSQMDKDPAQRTAQGMTTAESLSLLTNIIQQNPQIVGLLSNLSTVLPAINTQEMFQHPPLPNPMLRTSVQNMQQVPMNHYADKRDIENWINRQQYTLPNFQSYLQKEHGDDSDSGIFIPSGNRHLNGFEERSCLGSKPESSASSTSSNDTPDYKTTNSFLKKLSQSNEPSLGTEIHQLLGEYGNKKLSANRAMQQPIGDGVRTPSQLWSGYGFSKSMPDFAARAAKRAAQNSGSISEFLDSNMDSSKANGMGTASTSKTWSNDLLEKCDSPLDQVPSPFSFSNFWETVPKQPTINFGAIRNIEQLLGLLDLEKYVELFHDHEVDFPTFLTLTEVDLRVIGISYMARRKIMAAISAIRDHKMEDCSLRIFRAAPGAERRTLTSRYPSSSSSPGQDEGNSRM